MLTHAKRAKFLGTIAAIHAFISCADDPRSGRDNPPLGAATQRTSGNEWSIRTGDFNGDRMFDVLWLNPANNSITVWLMDGTRVLARGPELPGPTGDGWTVSLPVDFNGDGLFDLLWVNPVKNSISIWLMNGTHVLARGPELPGPIGNGWTALPDDFNGDGLFDVLWFNPVKNSIILWWMDGTHLVMPEPEIFGPTGDGWTVLPRDFNGDRVFDLQWFNPGKNVTAIWLMDGARVLARGPELPGPTGPGWISVRGGSFNNDPMTDLFWFNPAKNSITVWLMDGTRPDVLSPEIPGPSGSGWTAIPADSNFDANADVFWYNPGTNQFTVWLMHGTHVLAKGPEIPGQAW
jgi:hypothetical protein